MDFEFASFLDTVVRLVVAVVLGGLIGIERQVHGRWAGSRTHMMVAMGAAVFVMAGIMAAGKDNPEQITRIVQGVATGVGFLGAGTILKLSDRLEIKGLTTASSIWLAAALGTVAGLKQYELAAAGTIVSLLVLALLRPVEKRLEEHLGPDDKPPSDKDG